MRGLSPDEIVRLWEEGAAWHPLDRALAVLGAAERLTDWTSLGELPLGERDQRLLALHARMFGAELDASASCPRCASAVELRVPIDSLCCPRDERPPTDSFVHLSTGRRRVRPLSSRDLASAAHCATTDDARRVLAARCVEPLAAGDAIAMQASEEMSEADLEAIACGLERVDPGVVRTFDLTCPDCGERWECELDVADFLWIEIETLAIRLLRDVHVIARAYGWPERDILAMTPLRRRAYLELVQ